MQGHYEKIRIMAVMRETAESLYFGYAELCTPQSDTLAMREESKFRIEASITFDNSEY